MKKKREKIYGKEKDADFGPNIVCGGQFFSLHISIACCGHITMETTIAVEGNDETKADNAPFDAGSDLIAVKPISDPVVYKLVRVRTIYVCKNILSSEIFFSKLLRWYFKLVCIYIQLFRGIRTRHNLVLPGITKV